MNRLQLIIEWICLAVFLAAGIFFAARAGWLFLTEGYAGAAAEGALVIAVLAVLCGVQTAVLITAQRRHWRNLL